MEHKAVIIYETKEVSDIYSEEAKSRRLIDNKIIAGKMAGICYMSEDYLDHGLQDSKKAIKRAEGTAKSGHYSTYEHSHVTFLIETNKMMAMILNSLNCYSTSEKSARYTSMNPETELEKEYYVKWQDVIGELIKSYNKDEIYSGKEISKLAIENARYMISVFTPTILSYTVPYGRAVLTVSWLRSLCKGFEDSREEDISHADPLELKARNNFYTNMLEGLTKIADSMEEQLGFNEDNPLILDDHKRIGIELFSTLSFDYKTAGIPVDENIPGKDGIGKYSRRSYYGNVYTDNYVCSYAALAQEQRHRTIHYQIYKFNGFDCCYIPKIIKNTPYENEWVSDYNNLIKNGIIPQGTLVDVIEEGRFEDWVLKTKERLCSRAQLEICDITREQVEKFVKNANNLCYQNKLLIKNMISSNLYDKENIRVIPRCKSCGYTCKEPCAQANDNILYNRIV